jgi:UDP-N-acetylmuramyl pentapeptide phosphotransferase/UDP-N-acetylglucosamine-1-phosphate transferase
MELFRILFACFIGFILVIIVIPPIIKVGKHKRLFDHINERKIHTKIVPPLGGVAIFIGFTISTILANYQTHNESQIYLLAAVIVIFFTGLKDDLIEISPSKKIVLQIVAALIIVILGDFRFTNLHGILGIHEINFGLGIIISLFTIIVISNAFNLLDGVDGLASGLAISSSVILGIWFAQSGYVSYSIYSFSLVGCLAGFFIYNVFGDGNKLFLGDTGSLIIGLLISVLIIKFNELNIAHHQLYQINSAPALSFSIIIIPLVDTIRVMAIRIKQKKSPFLADNNHIHHKIYQFTKSHIAITIILIISNVTLFLFSLYLSYIIMNINLLFLIILFTALIFSFMPDLFIQIRDKKKKLLLMNQRGSHSMTKILQYMRTLI